ncbi:MAG: glycerol-3-phosphate acyltransferase [Spirochaetota bacterium]
MLQVIILFIAAYLAGSVNIAILLFKIIGKEDPRSKFSGNAGTVNIYRQAGLFWAAVVFILDFSKAIGLSALSLHLLEPEFAPLICLGLLLGNRFPCFHGFRGGKGVANFLGFTAVITPIWAGAAAAVWVIVYLIVKTPFIASLSMTILLAIGIIIANQYNQFSAVISILIVLFIIYNHKINITEFKKNFKNQSKSP